MARARVIASADGSEQVDTRHLLAAAVEHDSTRRLLIEAGAEPDRIKARLDVGAQGRPRTEPTTLTPAAKRALLDAYRISRAEGSTYIGPEHLLRALAADARSAAGRALAESGLESGRLPDGHGRTVDFKNTVVIMTSNLGADRVLAAGVTDYAKVRESVLPVLREHFRPEFLNRVDEIIVFRGLERDQLREVVDLLLEHTRRRLHAQDVTLSVSDAASDLLAELGYQPAFGARPLRRTIRTEVDDRLADLLLAGELKPGDEARVDALDGAITVGVGAAKADEVSAAEA